MNIKTHRKLSLSGKAILVVAIFFAFCDQTLGGVRADTLHETGGAIGGGRDGGEGRLGNIAARSHEISKVRGDDANKPFTPVKTVRKLFKFLGTKARPSAIPASEVEVAERELEDGDDPAPTSSPTHPIIAMGNTPTDCGGTGQTPGENCTALALLANSCYTGICDNPNPGSGAKKCTFEPATQVCRNAAGDCDEAEYCTGTSGTCPGNAFKPATQVCRNAVGDCDEAEYCTGTSGTCPGNAFKPATQVCRNAAGDCDEAEYCTGTSGTCPGDTFLPATTECRSAVDICDKPEYCTGTSADCPFDYNNRCPSSAPSSAPSLQPSSRPSSQPSSKPSSQPSSQPSDKPSLHPSSQPSEKPSSQPSSQPSDKPSLQPSSDPSSDPSSRPSEKPSNPPTPCTGANCCTGVICNLQYVGPISVANGGFPISSVFDNTGTCSGITYKLNGADAVGSTKLTTAKVYDVVATHGSGSTQCFVVMYDPSGGFVTGGGFIESPPEAYAKDLTMKGRANFGFNAKYKKGATVPDGETTFVFQAGGFKFKSTSYDWLVVEGTTKAKYKGYGQIEGLPGTYSFMLNAQDKKEPSRTCATATATDPADTFRIQITGPTGGSGGLVYDNFQQASASSSYAGTCIGGGSIKIHTQKRRVLRGDNSE